MQVALVLFMTKKIRAAPFGQIDFSSVGLDVQLYASSV